MDESRSDNPILELVGIEMITKVSVGLASSRRGRTTCSLTS
jgi:hypothetical protein